jgi:hypothetical protein
MTSSNRLAFFYYTFLNRSFYIIFTPALTQREQDIKFRTFELFRRDSRNIEYLLMMNYMKEPIS